MTVKTTRISGGAVTRPRNSAGPRACAPVSAPGRAPVLALILGLALCLCACTSSGPQKTLDDLANALETKNNSAFLACIDMPAFAASHIRNMTANDPALNSLNALGELLGLGGLDNLIGSVIDMRGRLEQGFKRSVTSGELMAQCRTADTPDCPWVPKSLRDARIVELGDAAAIARVTTPTGLSSWLALRKVGERWLVTGQAVLEDTARAYATGQGEAGGQGGKAAAPGAAPKATPKDAPGAAPKSAPAEGVTAI